MEQLQKLNYVDKRKSNFLNFDSDDIWLTARTDNRFHNSIPFLEIENIEASTRLNKWQQWQYDRRPVGKILWFLI